MTRLFHPFLALLATSCDRELAKYIQYLKEENKILQALIPGIIHTRPAERERLLKFGKTIGKAIEELITIVTPGTFYRWLRDERNGKPKSKNPKGGQRKPKELRELVLKIAVITGFGLTRILGELRKLGIKKISRQTVRNILKEEGIEPSDELNSRDTYQYDVVHLAREKMAGLSEKLARRMVDAYKAKDRKAFAKTSREFLQLIRDMDELLATRREFLFGTWQNDARRWGKNDRQRRHYECNARNIITLWGQPYSHLHEYANRQWTGLMNGFYLRRWEQFIARLDESLENDQPFDKKKFEKDIREWEYQWTRRNDPYPTKPQGDPVATSRRMWNKYGKQCSPIR